MTEVSKKPTKLAPATVPTTTTTTETPKKAPKVWTFNDLIRAQRGVKGGPVRIQHPPHKPIVAPAITATQIKNEG